MRHKVTFRHDRNSGPAMQLAVNHASQRVDGCYPHRRCLRLSGWRPRRRDGPMDSTQRVDIRCSAIVFRGDTVLLLRRDRAGDVDWVLPGGTPNLAESIMSCVRREVAEETDLQMNADRVAFVLEASNVDDGVHQIDMVLTATEADPRAEPQRREPDLTPEFHPVAQLASLRLLPPIAGFLRGLHASGGRGGAPYLGNLWRANDRADGAGDRLVARS